MNEIKIGDILVNKKSGISYRIIYISNNEIVVCQMNLTRLEIFSILIKTVFAYIENGDYGVEKKENILLIPETLSVPMQKQYETNKNIINDICEAYGPTFLGLMGNGRKRKLTDIEKKYNVSRLKCTRLLVKYLQSGLEDAALVDPRALKQKKYKEYTYTKRPGRKSDCDITSKIILTDEVRSQFDSAIEKYKEDRHQTIESTYQWLLQKYYTEYKVQDGNIIFSRVSKALCPSLKQYYTYFKQVLSKEEIDVIKTSAREVRNDKRILNSDSLNGVYGPGDMAEIDAVEVDISVVSELDRGKTVGRPVMYVMVDIYTRMILAMAVSFDNNSMIALSNLFLNLSDDKIEFCRKYGFEINEEAWLSGIIPRHIRVDRGADFRSDKFANILRELGIDRQLVSAASGSLKGTVEQEFRSLHYAIKPHMAENGVITQRYDSQHHEKASITITEFTKMAIAFVLHHNQNASSTYPLTPDMIRNGVHANPQELWNYGCKKYGAPRPIVNRDQYYYSLLKPVKVRINREGIKALGLFYTTTDSEIRREMYENGRKSVVHEMRYDPRDVSRLYYIDKQLKLAIAPLNTEKTGMQGYIGMTEYELKMYKDYERKIRVEDKTRNRKNKADLYAAEKMISEEALSNKEKMADSSNMRENRNIEKQRVQYENRVATRIDEANKQKSNVISSDVKKMPLDEEIRNDSENEVTDPTFDDLFDKYF